MKKRRSTCFSKKFIHFLMQILSGSLGMRSIILTTFVTVLLVLGYISMQIYISRMVERARELNNELTISTEKLNHLASSYAYLSSRSRVSEFCRKRLQMKQAGGNDLVRIAVEVNADFRDENKRITRIGVWFDDNLALRYKTNSLTKQ